MMAPLSDPGSSQVGEVQVPIFFSVISVSLWCRHVFRSDAGRLLAQPSLVFLSVSNYQY